jgi:hypothetical protein
MTRCSSIALALVVASCVGTPTETVPVPADGRVTAESYAGRITATVPAPVRQRAMRTTPGIYYFMAELGPDHTLLAGVVSELFPSGDASALAQRFAGLDDAARLELVAAQIALEERRSPGRQGAVLRSREQLGQARPPQVAQGAVCEEHALVAEDRQVPGHVGEPFVYRQRTYNCIHPRTHLPVQLHYSERYREASVVLRPAFESEAAFFFDSLQFD